MFLYTMASTEIQELKELKIHEDHEDDYPYDDPHLHANHSNGSSSTISTQGSRIVIKRNKYKLEGPWTRKIEELLETWKRRCLTKAAQHEAAGYIFKSKTAFWGLPPVLIPIAMSPVSAIIGYSDCDGTQWKVIFNSCAFLVSGVFAGIYSFFKYGEKTEKFFNYSTRYADIALEIESELIKEKTYRLPSEVFIVRIEMLMDNVQRTEPVLPMKVISMNFEEPVTSRKLTSNKN